MRTQQTPSMISVILTLVIFGAVNVYCRYDRNNTGNAYSGILQWRNRIPVSSPNPDNIGSYSNTIEMRNDLGATNGYDLGLDFDLDISIMPNVDFYVNYIPHGPEKVEFEFTPITQIGDSYTALLSFEDRTGGGTHFNPNTIEFLSLDLSDNVNGVEDFTFDLKVDKFNDGFYTHFDTGNVNGTDFLNWQRDFGTVVSPVVGAGCRRAPQTRPLIGASNEAILFEGWEWAVSPE